MTELDLSGGWRIDLQSRHATGALAAAELDRFLGRVAGGTSNGHQRPPLPIALAHGDGPGEGFGWAAGPRGLDLRGDGPAGLLYAVYSLLEAIGCRWPWPGPDGERVPRGSRFHVPDERVQEAPALPGRCLVLGHGAFLDQVEEWLVWAARNRLNAVFAHVSTRSDPFGAAPEALWRQRRERAVALARERAMTIEHGGHLLPELLPRRALRQLEAALTAPSSKAGDALAALRDTVAEHARTHPEVEVFHLWGADVSPAGWSARESLSPSEAALAIANGTAEVLEEVAPTAQAAFLAYHDTEAVAERVRPRSNVCLLWAPRERCYAHGIDDPACPVNVPHYRDTFRAQVAHFRAAAAPPVRVFEYYLDAILFDRGVPVLGAVMAQDMAFYRGEGAHTVQALMTGTGGWEGPHPNPWLFARLAWNPEQEPEALLREFCEAVFGSEEADTWAERYLAVRPPRVHG